MVVSCDERDLCSDSSFESEYPSFAFCFLSLCLCALLVLLHCGMSHGFRVFVLNINGILRMTKVHSGVSGISHELSQ